MANYYHQKRKKIRGWKRRIKYIERWGEDIKTPYLLNFNKNGYVYDRCYLPSFYMLEKRHPPLWFYKKIIEKFIIAFKEWSNIFKTQGTPFDLLIWLYDPAYIRSEIICYKMDNPGGQKTFGWESEISKSFPFQKFAHPSYDLGQFEWTLGDDDLVIFQSEIDDEGLDVNEYLAYGYVKKTPSEHGVYYTYRLGDIWMGRYKSN